MRVYLGSDHAGFELKTYLLEHLAKAGHEVVDCGPEAYDPDDDYPPYCFRTAERVLADPGSLGVVIGGSGNGEQIAANKVPGIRAALAWSEETAHAGPRAQRRAGGRGRRPDAHQGPGGDAGRHVPGHAVQQRRAARPPDQAPGRVRSLDRRRRASASRRASSAQRRPPSGRRATRVGRRRPQCGAPAMRRPGSAGAGEGVRGDVVPADDDQVALGRGDVLRGRPGRVPGPHRTDDADLGRAGADDPAQAPLGVVPPGPRLAPRAPARAPPSAGGSRPRGSGGASTAGAVRSRRRSRRRCRDGVGSSTPPPSPLTAGPHKPHKPLRTPPGTTAAGRRRTPGSPPSAPPAAAR